MTGMLSELLERARTLPGKGRRLIGIAGAPGAGKSTLAAALADAVGAVVVPMDGFHHSNEQLRALGRLERKGAPDTFDLEGYVGLLRRLRSDPGVVFAPEFDRAAEAVRPEAIAVPPGALVVTEGNYLLLDQPGWREVRPLLDAAWFVQTAEPVRVERLVARLVQFGWDRELARRRVTSGSDAANARLIAGTRERAELIVPVT